MDIDVGARVFRSGGVSAPGFVQNLCYNVRRQAAPGGPWYVFSGLSWSWNDLLFRGASYNSEDRWRLRRGPDNRVVGPS
jgi:hypothetical protein